LNIQQNLCRNHKSQMRLWVYALDFAGLQEYCNETFPFRHSILEATFSNFGGDCPGWNFLLTFYSPSTQMPRQYLYYTTAASLQSTSNSSYINRSTIWDTDSVVKYRTLSSTTGLYKRCNHCIRV
jgi:predicted transcriptional regulator